MEKVNTEPVNLTNSNPRKRLHSQSRSRSYSQSSVENKSSSSSDECSSRGPRAKRSRRKDSQTVSRTHFEFLSQQVAFLTNLICTNKDLNKEDKNNNNTPSLEQPESAHTTNQLDILSDLGTTVKEPIYQKTDDRYLSKLMQLQRFNCDDWYAIRFSDSQKKYLTTPGFVELKVNDELKCFESAMLKEDSRSYLIERSFAALTNALLTQKFELQQTLQTLIDWANDVNVSLTPNSLFEKNELLFSKDSTYSSLTDDILQIVCGRRADLIKLRRKSLLNQISEKFHREILHKIPPSSESLFNDEGVHNYLRKIGGVDKLVSRPKTTNQSWSKDKFYNHQKPSTSKQTDDEFFRQEYSSKRGKHVPRSNRGKAKASNGDKTKGKKSRSYNSKNKRRD